MTTHRMENLAGHRAICSAGVVVADGSARLGMAVAKVIRG